MLRAGARQARAKVVSLLKARWARGMRSRPRKVAVAGSPRPLRLTTEQALAGVGADDLAGYDFFDFGCGSGNAFRKLLDGAPELRGLGFDMSEAKVQLARAQGVEAVVGDVLALPPRKLVDFVTMSHFLEHLESKAQAQAALVKGIDLARDLVVVRQPWFDSDGDLFQLGLKYYWSDWRGHTNRMLTLDLFAILRDELERGRIRAFRIAGRRRVTSSAHTAILPLTAPVNQHHYQPDKHGPKPLVRFKRSSYEEVVAIIDVSGRGASHSVLDQLEPLDVLFTSPD